MPTWNRDDLQTGDLLLFHHENDCKNCFNAVFSCFTGLIECCTDSKFSHVAIVIRDPTFTDPPMKGLYVLESSFETFRDAVDHKYKFGVELEDYDKVINSAKQHETIYWRKLNCARDANFYNLLNDAYNIVKDKPYDVFPKDWINALIHKKDASDGQVTSRFFCSALVAYVYFYWGFLPDTVEWTLVTPKMLSSEPHDNYKLHFKNCKVSPEIQIEN